MPGATLHIEAAHTVPIGMLACRYSGPNDVPTVMERLAALDVGTHDCHQWFVDREVEHVRQLAVRTDPRVLLNPGSGSQRTSRIAPGERVLRQLSTQRGRPERPLAAEPAAVVPP